MSTRLTRELIASALRHDPQALGELHRRGTQEVFDAAMELLSSTPMHRTCGAQILSQLGSPNPRAEMRTACADAVLALIAREEHPLVLEAAGIALSHLKDPRAVAALLPLASHPNPDVRHGVAHGLMTHDDPATVAALIQLSSDEDRDVRNYATFALGSMTELDTPALREALFARLGDEDREVRSEGIVGLALRKDPRVVEPLRRELRDPDVTVGALNAAEVLGDKSFLPALLAMRDEPEPLDPYFRSQLENAIAALS
jgi:HEAT repeat protein